MIFMLQISLARNKQMHQFAAAVIHLQNEKKKKEHAMASLHYFLTVATGKSLEAHFMEFMCLL